MAGPIRDFETFFDSYLRDHAKPTTRALHYVGTSLGMAMLFFALLTQRWWLVPVAIVVGYAFAWIGHFFVEKNRPATFTHPLWSLAGDYKMLWLFMTGRLDAALKRAGVNSE